MWPSYRGLIKGGGSAKRRWALRRRYEIRDFGTLNGNLHVDFDTWAAGFLALWTIQAVMYAHMFACFMHVFVAWFVYVL